MGRLWLETHTEYIDPLNEARKQVDDSYQELQEEEYYRYSGSKGGSKGKGKGGKGNSKGKGDKNRDDIRSKGKGDNNRDDNRSKGKGGRSNGHFGDDRDERPVQAKVVRKESFKAEAGSFPGLPKPAPAAPRYSNKEGGDEDE